MRRFLLVMGVGLALGPAASAQPIDAEITYYHRAKKAQDTVKGTIVEESPGLIHYRTASRVEKVPAADVVDVVYTPEKALAKQDYRRAQRHEDEIDKAADAEARQKAVRLAMESYQALLPQMSESRYAQRHIAFKLARLTTRLAEDDPAQRDAAIAALSKFLQEHGSGWQVGQASKALAQLQLDKGDLPAAQKTFEALAAKPDLTRETRQEYQLLAVRSLIRSGKHDEAQKELKSIQARLPPDDTGMLTRVNIYLADCRAAAGQLDEAAKQLRTVLEGSAEPPDKALACNTLADCYRKAGKAEDAFWLYLMVDVLYNQDPEEHARALYHLAQLFDQVKKNPARAQECRERLLKEKQFAGAEYRRMAMKEK